MISKTLAEFVHNCRYESLPENVRELAGQCLLDWAGSAIRGSVEPPARMFSEVAMQEGGAPRATALANGFKTSATWAAQINAAASHTMEMDDLHPTSVLHPAAPIISAAVAVAESVNADGKALIEAIVAGYEVGIRAGEAAGRSHYHYWHTTATCGTFGAAAAAGRLLRLTPDQLVEAFGSAGTQAAGLWQFLDDGAMSKQLHPAHAAAAGILSAELARRGFTGAKQILEGRKGFLAAMSKDPAPEILTADLGKSYRIATNSFKKHASCRHTHSSIDSALILRNEKGVRVENIGKVEVRIYPAGYDLLNGMQPATDYAAKFCLPYTVAAAFARGRVGLAEFENLQADDIRSTMERISLVRDESLAREYPEKWPAHVTVTLESGESRTASVEYPKGDSKNPLSLEELEDKFRALTAKVISNAQQQHIIEKCRTIEKCSTRELWPF
ncbi:MAG: MmgE/PrpD family protein [Acidobacteria bacterium]|nr:MmgE/PrpD family protein [Acidobacteriota bacterium]